MKKELQEEWKPIKNYEALYEISNTGQVRRLRNTNAGKAGSFLSQNCDKAGYKRVCLCQNGKSKRYSVHRLVADHFLEGFNVEVNHINGDKSDNSASNLEWCSHKINMIKAAQTGLIKSSKKIQQKLNGQVIKVFPSLSEASRTLAYNKANISKCCNGKRKTAYGYEWSWAA